MDGSGWPHRATNNYGSCRKRARARGDYRPRQAGRWYCGESNLNLNMEINISPGASNIISERNWKEMNRKEKKFQNISDLTERATVSTGPEKKKKKQVLLFAERKFIAEEETSCFVTSRLLVLQKLEWCWLLPRVLPACLSSSHPAARIDRSISHGPPSVFCLSRSFSLILSFWE